MRTISVIPENSTPASCYLENNAFQGQKISQALVPSPILTDLIARRGESIMSIFVSAILSELANRSISFLIDRSIRLSTEPQTVEEALNSLQRLLLRAHVVVEEAEVRFIANRAMLQLLNRLRLEMYRGHQTLDTYRCRANEGSEHQAVQVSIPSASSSFNLAKRFRLCGGSSGSGEQQERINEAVGRLEVAMRDAGELVVFLAGCPRLHWQPYNMHLLLDNCVFGRHMEMERIMSFLLEEEAPGADEHPGVLPVIGPGKVGKTTIIEYACNNDRVRNRFSRIVCFSQDSIKDQRKVAALSDCDVVKHHNPAVITEESRMLVVIELARDMDEGEWMEFYSDCKRHLASGSKIIVAGRSEAMARFGTTPALRVQFFSQEAYWYFFKVRTFGSTNAEDHPKLVSIAMEMARELNGCFFSAHLHSRLLRANFDDVRFWSMALEIVKQFKRMNRFLLYGSSHFVDPWQVDEPVYMMKKKPSEYLVILDDYQTASMQNSDQNGVPMLCIKDLVLGRVRPRGKFKVLAWRSHLPPHYSYMMNCEVRRLQRGMAISKKKKVSQQIMS